MTELILICSCFRMDKRAVEAFAVLFPNAPVPEVVKGKDKISKLAQTLGNEHIKAIAKLSGRFAYYIKLDKDKIIEEWDLQKGNRIG